MFRVLGGLLDNLTRSFRHARSVEFDSGVTGAPMVCLLEELRDDDWLTGFFFCFGLRWTLFCLPTMARGFGRLVEFRVMSIFCWIIHLNSATIRVRNERAVFGDSVDSLARLASINPSSRPFQTSKQSTSIPQTNTAASTCSPLSVPSALPKKSAKANLSASPFPSTSPKQTGWSIRSVRRPKLRQPRGRMGRWRFVRWGGR